MNHRRRLLVETGVCVAVALTASMAFGSSSFLQDFEDGTSPGDPQWGATTVASGGGALGLTSAGGSYHAETSGGFTRHNGYGQTWDGGFTVSIDIYIDLALAQTSGFQFDLTQAISQGPSGSTSHRRDFFFNVNTTTNDQTVWADGSTGATNVGGNYIRGGGLGGTPFQFTSSDWYTFEWQFTESAGLLNVDTSINGTPVHQFHPSHPTDSIAGLPVAGHRYMWFATAAQTMGIDNSQVTYDAAVVPVPAAVWSGFVLLGGMGAVRTIRRKLAA